MSEPTVLVVIVNFRTADLTIECLRSLAPEVARNPSATVAVVDNASGDGSAQAIAAAIKDQDWWTWATLVRAPVNGGFSYGNNLAMRSALASSAPPAFVWLLNPDTRVRPDALGQLVAFLVACPQAGIAGSSFEVEDGTVWPHAFRFPSLWSELASGLRLAST